MFAKLTALVSGGPTLPYIVDEGSQEQAWGNWTHQRGTGREDGTAVSVFKITCPDPNDRRLVAGRNGVKRLKLLRHPNVLTYKDSHEISEKGGTTLYLITEPVSPLARVLKEVELGSQRGEYIALGLLQVATAVAFINNDCKMIHGNVCLASVVVTEALDWKLHGFDLLGEHAAVAGYDAPLAASSWVVGAQYKCAEVAKADWRAVAEAPAHAVDAWGLGCLMQEIFSGSAMSSVDQLRRTEVIPPQLLTDYYQKLLASTPARRLNPAKLTESPFLKANKLVGLAHFMDSIAVRDGVEKESFFKKLPSVIPGIPHAVAVRKLLPLLASSLEFGGAPPSALSSLLLIAKSLDEVEMGRRVVPCIAKLFASSDRSLRRALLESLDQYAKHLSNAVAEEQVFPQLATGFSDANGYIRELTLKAVLQLAPSLSQRTLTQSVLKHLSKLQVDEEPSIRANTTVLLGNLAPLLGEVTCKKVLLNAFSRALKDSFPPARIAGLRAISATRQYYSAEEAAARVLPAVAPLAVDPVKDVRAASLACLDMCMTVLREHDVRMVEAAAASAESAANNAAHQTTSAGASMLGWAVSSLGWPAAAAAPAAAAPAAAAKPPAAMSSSSGTIPPRPRAPVPPAAGYTTTGRQASGSGGAAPFASSTTTNSSSRPGDGWDDDDDDFEPIIDPEEQAARDRLLSRGTAKLGVSGGGPRPAAAAPPKPPADPLDSMLSSLGSKGSAGDGWNDGDGWDGIDAAPQAPLPRRPSGGVALGASRPASSSSGSATGGAAPRKGGLKLGATKLGAVKLSEADLM